MASLLDRRFCVYIVYHPPSGTKLSGTGTDFYSDFDILFTEASISTVPVIILGDFKIYYNNVHKSIKLDSFDMNQHVAGATHKQGNILDLVITPNHDNLIKSVTVCDYNISDHYSVEDLLVNHPKARIALKRSLNNIDMDVFIADLCIVNDRLLSKNVGDTNEIVCTFNISLCKLLGKHAPLKKIRIRTKPHSGTIKRLRVREYIDIAYLYIKYRKL